MTLSAAETLTPSASASKRVLVQDLFLLKRDINAQLYCITVCRVNAGESNFANAQRHNLLYVVADQNVHTVWERIYLPTQKFSPKLVVLKVKFD